jgi:hypothetical protein
MEDELSIGTGRGWDGELTANASPHEEAKEERLSRTSRAIQLRRWRKDGSMHAMSLLKKYLLDS